MEVGGRMDKGGGRKTVILRGARGAEARAPLPQNCQSLKSRETKKFVLSHSRPNFN